MKWTNGNTDWFKSVECVNTLKGIYHINLSPTPYSEEGNDGVNIRYINKRIEHLPSVHELKQLVLEIQKEFDSSLEVNGLTVNGKKVWLDKSTRVGLINSLTVQKEHGDTESTLWFNSDSFTVNIDAALAMLKAIELYAIVCYNNTQQHIASINSIESQDELLSYDVTIGYPEQLVFNV